MNNTSPNNKIHQGGGGGGAGDEDQFHDTSESWEDMERRLQSMQARMGSEMQAALARKHHAELAATERAARVEAQRVELLGRYETVTTRLDRSERELSAETERRRSVETELEDTRRALARTEAILSATRETEARLGSEAKALLDALSSSESERDELRESLIASRNAEAERREATQRFQSEAVSVLEGTLASLDEISALAGANKRAAVDAANERHGEEVKSLSQARDLLKDIVDGVKDVTSGIRAQLVDKDGEGIVPSVRNLSASVESQIQASSEAVAEKDTELSATCASSRTKMAEHASHLKTLTEKSEATFDEYVSSLESNVADVKVRIDEMVQSATTALSDARTAQAERRAAQSSLLAEWKASSLDAVGTVREKADARLGTARETLDVVTGGMTAHHDRIDSVLSDQRAFLSSRGSSHVDDVSKQASLLVEQDGLMVEAKRRQEEMRADIVRGIMEGVQELVDRQMSLIATEEAKHMEALTRSNEELVTANGLIARSAREIPEMVGEANAALAAEAQEVRTKEAKVTRVMEETNDTLGEIADVASGHGRDAAVFADKADANLAQMVILDAEEADNVLESIRTDGEECALRVEGAVLGGARDGAVRLTDSSRQVAEFAATAVIPDALAALSAVEQSQRERVETFDGSMRQVVESLGASCDEIERIASRQGDAADDLRNAVESKEAEFNDGYVANQQATIDSRKKELTEMATKHEDAMEASVSACTLQSAKVKSQIVSFAANANENKARAIPRRKDLAYSRKLSSTPAEEVILQGLDLTPRDVDRRAPVDSDGKNDGYRVQSDTPIRAEQAQGSKLSSAPAKEVSLRGRDLSRGDADATPIKSNGMKDNSRLQDNKPRDKRLEEVEVGEPHAISDVKPIKDSEKNDDSSMQYSLQETMSSILSLSHEESSEAKGDNILMEAIRSGAWDLTIDIVRQSPSEASKWDVVTIGKAQVWLLPLHYACFLNPPLNAVEALIKAAPDNLTYVDQNGWTLLHWAIDNGNASPDIIQYILRRYPESAKRRGDKYGCLPLHIACYNSKQRQERLTNYEQLTIVQLLLSAFPEGASIRERNRGWLPLHIAAKTGAPFEVIVALLEACSSAAAVGDKDNRLPIHYATRYSQMWGEEEAHRIIEALCASSPAGLKRREKKYGFTPLAAACSVPCPRKNAISTLLLHCPGAASVPDLNLSLPLHAAARANADIAVIDQLLRAYSSGAQEGDNNGMLPLHWACMNSSIHVVEMLIQAFPSGTSQMEIHNNFLPIHLAVKHGADEDVILSLLFHYPNGAGTMSASGALPIHLACENSAKVSLRSLEKLIIAYPEGLNVKDSHGRRPSDYAKMINDDGTASAFLDILARYSINEVGVDETKAAEDSKDERSIGDKARLSNDENSVSADPNGFTSYSIDEEGVNRINSANDYSRMSNSEGTATTDPGISASYPINEERGDEIISAEGSLGERPSDDARLSNEEGSALADDPNDVSTNYSIKEGADEAISTGDSKDRRPDDYAEMSIDEDAASADPDGFSIIEGGLDQVDSEDNFHGRMESRMNNGPAAPNISNYTLESVLEDVSLSSENPSAQRQQTENSPQDGRTRANALHRQYNLPFDGSARARYSTTGGRIRSRFRETLSTPPPPRAAGAALGRDDSQQTVSTQGTYFVTHDEDGDAKVLRGC